MSKGRAWLAVGILATLALIVLVGLAAATGTTAPAPATPGTIGTVDPAGHVNYWLLGGMLGTVLWTNIAMVVLKKKFPGWDSKAWAPPLIGVVTMVLGGLASGRVSDVGSLIGYVLAGLGSGGAASSLRDTVVGK